jgi:hypothetical protein
MLGCGRGRYTTRSPPAAAAASTSSPWDSIPPPAMSKGRQPCLFMAASVATAKSQRLSGSQRATLATTVRPRTRARNAATACRGAVAAFRRQAHWG